MIGQIRGKLIEVEDDKVVVDVGGVGYEIEVASSVLDTLPVDKDQEISLVCHFVVREDAQLLYGVSSKEERSLFRAYIRINGVGPRLGLALLSSLSRLPSRFSVSDCFALVRGQANVSTR